METSTIIRRSTGSGTRSPNLFWIWACVRFIQSFYALVDFIEFRLNNGGWCSQKLDEEIASTMPQDVFLMERKRFSTTTIPWSWKPYVLCSHWGYIRGARLVSLFLLFLHFFIFIRIIKIFNSNWHLQVFRMNSRRIPTGILKGTWDSLWLRPQTTQQCHQIAQ